MSRKLFGVEIGTGGSDGGTGEPIVSGGSTDPADSDPAVTFGNDGRIIFADPAEATSIGDSGPVDGLGKRKRGRPRGSTNKTSSAQRDIGIEGVANLLTIIHTALSAAVPELELDEKEARSLALASTNVMRHYNIEQSEKAIAWTGLIGVLATVYGPRAFAIRLRKMKPRPTVVPFPQGAQGFPT
jgi:hypothetical protein